ncbi:Large ribosomal subunit protein bL35c-like protein [Drosera capensis]
MAMASILSSPSPTSSLRLTSSFNPLRISSSSSHFSLDLTRLRRPPSCSPLKSSLKSSCSYSSGLTRGLGGCVGGRKNGMVLGWSERRSIGSGRGFAVVCAKGYKMKTHKASAKRFRVTGSGKIMRRKAGKQHLLRKKNTKRKVRLSKMVQVNRSDYNNVIGALPYLKVNRAK